MALRVSPSGSSSRTPVGDERIPVSSSSSSVLPATLATREILCEVIDLDNPTLRMYEYAPASALDAQEATQDGCNSNTSSFGVGTFASSHPLLATFPKCALLHPSSAGIAAAAAASAELGMGSSPQPSPRGRRAAADQLGVSSPRRGASQQRVASGSRSRGTSRGSPTNSQQSLCMAGGPGSTMEPTSSRQTGSSMGSSRGIRLHTSSNDDNGDVVHDRSYLRQQAMTTMPISTQDSGNKPKRRWSERAGDAVERVVTFLEKVTSASAPPTVYR
mmetsp:Transcript_17327/g.40377  ORF Transcript_17327/g.40377 Transcript_17327/m.40377 type:complete len:274 (-) Transcript_17327:18-839(-)